jgi:hypothetical protein
MKYSLTRRNWLTLGLFTLFLLMSCKAGIRKGSRDETQKPKEFFSAKINGVLWEACPSEGLNGYGVRYKPLSRQLSISVEAKDGSRIELSFHSIDKIVPGNYPSTKNDNGIESGVFYYPATKKEGTEMGSVTFEVPIQENTIQITKVEKTGEDDYLIEGTFSAVLYALSKADPGPAAKLTEGKLKVIYSPGLINPSL